MYSEVSNAMTKSSKTLTMSLNAANLNPVTGGMLRDLTRKIRELNALGKLYIRSHHIEKERIYREISIEQVLRVIENGQVVQVRESDSSVIWQGRDVDGRCLELNCTLRDDDGEVTVVVNDVAEVIVGTAYDPKVRDDDAVKAVWLKSHSDYEDAGKRQGVRKKIVVTKV